MAELGVLGDVNPVFAKVGCSQLDVLAHSASLCNSSVESRNFSQDFQASVQAEFEECTGEKISEEYELRSYQ